MKQITFPKTEIVTKTWGHEEILWNGEFCGKKLVFKKGHILSLHAHEIKSELFHLLEGMVVFKYLDYSQPGPEQLNLQTKTLFPGDQVFIPQFNFHSIEAFKDSVILEISSHHKDSDSYRLIKSKSL